MTENTREMSLEVSLLTAAIIKLSMKYNFQGPKMTNNPKSQDI